MTNRPIPRLAVRAFIAALVATMALASPLASSAQAAPDRPGVSKPGTKHVKKRVPRGTGFLPGYRTPAQIERQRYEEIQRERRAYYRAGGPRIAYWGTSDPRFYRGRWNGGSFGECWTTTPIGYQWNCGK
jgi:hypothetical protein